MEISCPHHRRVPIVVDENSPKEIGALSRGVGMVVYILMFIVLTVILPVGFSLIDWRQGSSIALYIALQGLVWGTILHYFGQTDKLIILPATISLRVMLCGMTLQKTDYAIDDITDVRVGRHHDALEFDYRGQTIIWGNELETGFVTTLSRQLSTILSFRYHSVERIIFGNIQAPNLDPHTTVQNVDASVLFFPFVHLRQILIQTTTYDFHQVEQFLTYAVNVIGCDYLKEYVDVHLYGDLERLHPNLRNNLTNLCHHVYVHKTEDMSNGLKIHGLG